MPDALYGDLSAGAVALVPAALAALWGRTLVRMADDAALPERLLAHRGRVAQVMAVAGAILVVALPRTLIWSLPLMILARAVAAFGPRRVLFGESWTLRQYLATGTRLYAGLLGFWVLLAASPALVDARRWWVAGVLAVILGSWSWWFPAVTLALLKARPLSSPALADRFAGIVARSTVPLPRVWRAGPAGAGIANALALHSHRGSSVLFSEALLQQLAEDEAAAIFAHEVAHLEIQGRIGPWRTHGAAFGLIVAGTILVPALNGALPLPDWPLHLAWVLFVLLYLGFRLRRGQEHELASDRRASELCGAPEALIRALVKLHALGRVPRRWEQQLEESASHPSLARRAQAIRAAAHTATATFGSAEIFRGADPGLFVIIDNDAVRWFRSVPVGTAENSESLQAAAGTLTAVRFGSIAELRVAARGISAPELILVERDGKKHSARMRADDLPRLQRTLDQVDIRVPPAPKSSAYPIRLIAVLASSLASVAATLTLQVFSVVLVALLAAFRPTLGLTTAAGIVSALGAILVVAGERHCSVRELMLLLGVLPLAATALWMRVRLRGETPAAEQLPPWAIWITSLATLAWWSVPLLASQGHLLQLSESFKAATGVTLLPLALAIMLSHCRTRRTRLGAALLLAAAGVAAVISTSAFRERIVCDPLLGSLPAFSVSEPPPQRIATFEVEPWASDLRIAPGGTRVALRHGGPDSDEEPLSPYTVYARDGSHTKVEAIDLQFIDDKSVLLLRMARGELELAAVPLDGGRPAWQTALAGHRSSGRLILFPADGRWRVLSQSREGVLTRTEGQIGRQTLSRTDWRPPSGPEPWTVRGIAGSGSASLWVRQSWTVPRFAWATSLLASLGGGYPVESTLYGGRTSSTLLARSESRAVCLDPQPGEDRFICLASRGLLTNALAVEPASGGIQALGTIPGNFWVTSACGGGIVAGSWNGVPALLRLRERQVVRLGNSSGEAACGGGLVGAVPSLPGRSEVVIWGAGKAQSRPE